MSASVLLKLEYSLPSHVTKPLPFHQLNINRYFKLIFLTHLHFNKKYANEFIV